MADVNTTIISTGSTTSPYASLALAEADDFGCTSGQSALCEYAEEMTDTTAVTINTTVPSSIEISVQSAYRHNGDVASGAVLSPTSGTRAIFVNVPITIRYLRINCASVTESGIYFYNVTGNSYYHNLFIYNVQAGDIGVRVQYNSSNVVVGYRSICSGVGDAQIAFCVYSNAVHTCYFCTGYAPNYSAFIGGSTLYCYGCIGFGTYPFYGTFSGDYNADNTSNATYQCPGSNSVHNLTPTDELTDPSNNDFSIKSGGTGTLIDLVDTTVYDAYFPDIAGNSKSGTYADCGAFEFISGESPEFDIFLLAAAAQATRIFQ